MRREESSSVCRRLGQRVEQLTGLNEILVGIALSEPFIDPCQKIAGLHVIAPIAPEASEAGGSAQFPVPGALRPRDPDCCSELGLSAAGVAPRRQQRALDSVQLG